MSSTIAPTTRYPAESRVALAKLMRKTGIGELSGTTGDGDSFT
jgi:hypothetical protein